MRVYSAGSAPWDSDDNMLPVIADDPLLQFGKLCTLCADESHVYGILVWFVPFMCMRHFMNHVSGVISSCVASLFLSRFLLF